MKKSFRLCLLALLIIPAACGPDEPTPGPSPSTKDEIKITSGANATIGDEGGSVTVQFTSSGEWTASLSNDRASSWLSLSATSGAKGSASISLTAAKNEDVEDRSATVRITCGSASASVTITQKQKDALTQTPSKTQIGADGGSFTIEVKANIEYSIEIGVDWIHKASTRALVTTESTFTVDRNEDTRKREGTVTVKSALGSERITIYQEAAEPSVILSSESVAIGTRGGSFTVDVNTNVDVTMTISAGAEWLSEVTTRAMSTHSYTFEAAPNEGTDSREGKISFRNQANGIEATVTVTQMQKDAFVISRPLYEIGAAGGSVSIEASTNVDLDVQVSESWVHALRTKSMNTVSYGFEVEPNTGYEVRECTITFFGGEEMSVFSQPSSWSLIGTMYGDNWTRDIAMETDGQWHVARGITFSDTDEFKFRKDKNWDVNLGALSYPGPTLPANVKVNLVQDGGNFKMVAGTYDFYLSPEKKMVYVLTAGTPFTFEGYEGTVERLSQTVTIRQDGADAFLPDFKDQYTVSSRQQTLELRARSSVEVVAESKCDWIRVMGTRALKDSDISLQIAENATGSSRTGEVVITVAALGESRTVTIAQKAAGEMYIEDAAFYAWLLGQFDKDGNRDLSEAECGEITEIEVNLVEHPDIKSVQGLEYFPNLTYLRLKWEASAGGADIEELDLSGNPKLRELSLTGLPKLKGITFGCPDLSTLGIRGCRALTGMDFSQFKHLNYLYLSDNPWLTVLDCSGNRGLYVISVELCQALTRIVATCPKLQSFYVGNCRSLPYSGIVFPQEGFDLTYLTVDTIASVPEDIDLSMCPGLRQISISSVADYWKISTIWLMTGISTPTLYGFARNAEIRYKGDNLLTPITFESDAFRDLVLQVYPNYDLNADGQLSAYELSKIDYFVAFSDYYSLSGTITTLEDIGHMKNLEHFGLMGFGKKVSAPIPESLKNLTGIETFSLDECRIQGTLPEWIADLPNLTEFSLYNSYPVGGEIPGRLLTSETLTYLDLTGCNFTGCTIVVPRESLMDYDSKYYHPNGYFKLGQQRELVRRETQDGGDYVYDKPNFLYQSDADGTGAIHPNGEAVLYHAATKGPGIDFVITGDGFSAENNTVGGTLETYLTACAEQFLHQEPYDKLAEYYNVWLVYAHSRTAGTGVQYDRCTLFGTRHANPEWESTVMGNDDAVLSFVSKALGRDCNNAVIAVIMNSSVYGGTCYWSYSSTFGSWNYTIAYTPAAPGYFLPTFTHETLGHGIGKLADEYNADSSNPGSSPSTYPYWETVGLHANVDKVSDPASVRWHNFLSDPRYASEGLGVFEGANYANYGWYRPSLNSVMNLQMDEGGERFNAPSRESIYQWTMFRAGGQESWSAYGDWVSYLAANYNYEQFVAFDLTPSPLSPRHGARKARRAPGKVVLHDGRVIERKLPPCTPPVIVNK